MRNRVNPAKTGLLIVIIALGLSVTAGAQVGNTPGSGFTTIIGSAMRYVMAYERKFSLLVAEETYVQELQRPTNPGDNLNQRNPGGGMRAGGAMNRLVLRSDFMLVQLGGDGEGWMSFRDVFEVKGAKVRERDDRLLKLFQTTDKDRFETGAKYNEETARHYVGNVARTINIPTLALMFLHPRVNERFEFTDEGEETIAGRVLRRAAYREAARPTLIKTTRGRDLALTGRLWIDPFTGTVVKTELNAADPAVRCAITVTFRKDEALDFWVPSQMDEYYKAALGLDEILATATYSNVRRFVKPSID